MTVHPSSLPPAALAPQKPIWKRPVTWIAAVAGLCVFCMIGSFIGSMMLGAELTDVSLTRVVVAEDQATAVQATVEATPDVTAVSEDDLLPEETAAPLPTLEPTEVAEPTATLEPPPLEFGGTGAGLTENFSTPGGVIIVEAEHQGSRNFALILRDASTAANVSLAVNTVGAYSGRRVIAVESFREYYLDVQADGPWSIRVLRADHLDAIDESSYAFSGTGDDVTPIFVLGEGPINFTFTHRGSLNFTVLVYDMLTEERADLLVNEIGEVAGFGRSEQASHGLYLLDVEADGEWEITITQP